MEALNILAGMGSRAQDLIGELVISFKTSLLESVLKQERAELASGSGKRAEDSTTGDGNTRAAWILVTFSMKNVVKSDARALAES